LPLYTCDERWALHVVIKRKVFTFIFAVFLLETLNGLGPTTHFKDDSSKHAAVKQQISLKNFTSQHSDILAMCCRVYVSCYLLFSFCEFAVVVLKSRKVFSVFNINYRLSCKHRLSMHMFDRQCLTVLMAVRSRYVNTCCCNSL